MSKKVFTEDRRAGDGSRRKRRLAAAIVGSALFAGSALAASPAGAASGALAADPHGPLTCSPGKIVMITPGTVPGENMRISYGTFAPGTIDFTQVAVSDVAWNSTGYNPLDGYVYGLSTDGEEAGSKIYQIGDDGSVTTVGTIDPALGTTNAGTFDNSGNFWVAWGGNGSTIWAIDVTTMEVTSVPLDTSVTLADLVYANGYLWALSGRESGLYRIDPGTGHVDVFPVSGLPDEPITAGGSFSYPNGDLGFFSQSLREMLRVRVSNPTSNAPNAQVISTQATTFPSGDATACSTSITDLGLQVSSPAAAAPNTPIDFTLQITNNGPHPSSGWSLSAPIPSNVSTATTSSPGCAVAGGVLTCTGGELASGASTSVVVSLTGPAAGSVHLEGTVSANDSDANSANNVDDSTTVIAADPGTPMLDPTVGGLLLGGLAMGAGVVVVSRNRRRSALR